MMRLYAALVFLLVVVFSAGAQDRIAVLDTELPRGMDTKVVIPVTEKIMEEFVRSKRFTVVDRSFITKTLSELEFSTSDLTSGDTDKLATIGGFLKATYIVVSTVQLLDRTFFLSAKMIEVKTGIISAQASVNRDGTMAVLIDMAGELGRKLVAAALGQDVQPNDRTATKQTSTASVRQQREQPVRGTRFSTISADFGTGVLGETSGLSYGVSTMFPSGLFYISGGAGLMDTASDEYPYAYEYFIDYYSDFDLYLGAGLDIMLGPVLVYAGPRISYTDVSLSIYDSDDDEVAYYAWSGIGFGLELGADLRIGSIAIGVRYAALSGELTSDDGYATSEFKNGTLMLRLSWAF
jgi:TolB-like protein